MSERGSIVPWLAALFFVGFVVLGLALDVALFAATYREAAFAADAGAEAGAARIDPRSVYEGVTTPDRTAAVRAAETGALDARPRPARRATARINGSAVCVTVVDRYEPRLAALLGLATESVSATACATPAKG